MHPNIQDNSSYNNQDIEETQTPIRQQTNSQRGTFSRTTNIDFSSRSMAGAEKESERLT